MKTTGISVFTPMRYGQEGCYIALIEHTQTRSGRDRLRSVTDGDFKQPFHRRTPDDNKPHSFEAWFAAMMRNDFRLWLAEDELSSRRHVVAAPDGTGLSARLALYESPST